MTLYEALAKKKIIEDRVYKMKNCRLVDIKKKYEDTSVSGIPVEEVKRSIQAGYDSTVALIDNLRNIKAAINEANAKIKITVAGKEYTIADAIARQRMLSIEEDMYNRMINNLNVMKADINRQNDSRLSPEAISDYVSKIVGDSKKDATLIDKLTEDYRKKYEVELYDPLNTEELATKKLKEISDFREQIHYVLTQANCTNTVTVEFKD